MPKVTYLLISTAVGQQAIPLIVQGHSGKVYGYAEYDSKVGHHAFRVDQQAYEQRPDGFGAKTMAEDLTANMHRPMARWVVLAEVEPDLESAEGKLAQEVDALKARIAELETRRDPHEKKLAEVADSMNELHIEQLAATFGLPPAKELTAAGEEPPRGFGATDLSEMGFDALESLFNKLNVEGAGLVLPPEGKPSKVKYRDALNAYYAKAA